MNPDEYRERKDALHAELVAALDPQTEQEQRIAQWLRTWDEPTLAPLLAMVRRARDAGSAGA